MPLTVLLTRVRGRRYGLAVVVAVWPFISALKAQERGGGAASLEQSVERIFGERKASPDAANDLSQVPTAMAQAGEELRSLNVPAALDRQRDALRLLDQLLQSASPQRQPQPGDGTDANQPMTGEPSLSPGSGNSITGPNTGESRESGSQAGGAQPAAVTIDQRRNLATSVWGHLPDREREQMLQSFPEEYAAEYEDLVESYYEALAAERLSGGPAPIVGEAPRGSRERHDVPPAADLP